MPSRALLTWSRYSKLSLGHLLKNWTPTYIIATAAYFLSFPRPLLCRTYEGEHSTAGLIHSYRNAMKSYTSLSRRIGNDESTQAVFRLIGPYLTWSFLPIVVLYCRKSGKKIYRSPLLPQLIRTIAAPFSYSWEVVSASSNLPIGLYSTVQYMKGIF